MGLMIKIIEIHGREILDSRGNPTVEVEVTAQTETTGKKTTGRESVPSGASTGRFEAIELRDGQERYFGLGVQRVVDHINTKIRKELLGMNVLEQVQIDRKLVELDGTDNKGNLGANALLGVSLACARCAAAALDMPLYRYLGGAECKKMADADDECHKWRSARKELPGFSGIYDCTGRSRVVSGCTPDGCGNLSFSEKNFAERRQTDGSGG